MMKEMESEDKTEKKRKAEDQEKWQVTSSVPLAVNPSVPSTPSHMIISYFPPHHKGESSSFVFKFLENLILGINCN